TPGRRSASPVRALAPRLDVPPRARRPPATETLFRVVSRPDLAPAVSTAAVRVAGSMLPLVMAPFFRTPASADGRASEMGPAFTVFGSPVDEALKTPTLPRFRAEMEDVTLAAVMPLLAEEG